jgi:hypothetical protein
MNLPFVWRAFLLQLTRLDSTSLLLSPRPRSLFSCLRQLELLIHSQASKNISETFLNKENNVQVLRCFVISMRGEKGEEANPRLVSTCPTRR